MGIPDHLTCLLSNLYAIQEATFRTGHGTMDWFQIANRAHQGCILSPCLCNLHAEHTTRNAGLDHKLESRLPGEISIISGMQMTPPLWQKVKRNSNASWWKWKRRVKKLAYSSTKSWAKSWTRLSEWTEPNWTDWSNFPTTHKISCFHTTCLTLKWCLLNNGGSYCYTEDNTWKHQDLPVFTLHYC